MPNTIQEIGNMTLSQVTGPSVITSGKAVILGVGFVGTGTGGVQLFAGVTQSASMTPMITFSATASAVAAGLSPMYFRMPMTVSGSGFTILNLGSTDPNLMIFWNPDGQV